MTTETISSIPTTEAAPAKATKPTATKKTAGKAKPSQKKPATKAEAKKSAKPEKSSKGGPTGRQIAVLKLLGKGACLTRSKMYDSLGYANHSGLNDVLGKNDPAKRAEADKKYPSLLTLGFIRMTEIDVDGRTEAAYEITGKGKQALERALKN